MSGADDFKWDELEKEAIVVKEAKETAVYYNLSGDVVIRQREWHDDDPFLVIPLHRVPALIERLQVLYKEATED